MALKILLQLETNILMFPSINKTSLSGVELIKFLFIVVKNIKDNFDEKQKFFVRYFIIKKQFERNFIKFDYFDNLKIH